MSYTKNQTGFRGVKVHHNRPNLRRPFYAMMKVKNEQVHLGHFKTPAEAARAYDHAAVERWGPEAVTNASLGLLPPEPAEVG